MKILFLHPNFPGQFKYLARSFARRGDEVKFLCQTHFGRNVPGVERICMKGPLSDERAEKESKGIPSDKSKIVANQYRTAIQKLKTSGWIPDVVISHSGWGASLHVKEIYSYCKHISYLEWWFGKERYFLESKQNQNWFNLRDRSFEKFWRRNETIALDLINADEIICPSIWRIDSSHLS